MSHHADINLFIVYFYNTVTIEHLYKVFQFTEGTNPFEYWNKFNSENKYLYRYIDSYVIEFKAYDESKIY